MDSIWLAVTNGVKEVIDFILSAYGKGALVAALLCLAIWCLQEWIVGPLFGLGPLKKAWPVYRALRPLFAVLASGYCFHFLHASGALDFGPGPQGWGIDSIYGIVGGALTMPLHDLLKTKAPALVATSRKAEGGAA